MIIIDIKNMDRYVLMLILLVILSLLFCTILDCQILLIIFLDHEFRCS